MYGDSYGTFFTQVFARRHPDILRSHAGNIHAYSDGLDAAVACHDYPQLSDMAARPALRRVQRAVHARAMLSGRLGGQLIKLVMLAP